MAKSKQKTPKAPAKSPKAPANPSTRSDAYTGLLFIAFLALAIGCTLLYLDFDEYGQQAPPKEPVPTLPKLGEEGRKEAPPPEPMPPDGGMPPAGGGGMPPAGGGGGMPPPP